MMKTHPEIPKKFNDIQDYDYGLIITWIEQHPDISTAEYADISTHLMKLLAVMDEEYKPGDIFGLGKFLKNTTLNPLATHLFGVLEREYGVKKQHEDSFKVIRKEVLTTPKGEIKPVEFYLHELMAELNRLELVPNQCADFEKRKYKSLLKELHEDIKTAIITFTKNPSDKAFITLKQTIQDKFESTEKKFKKEPLLWALFLRPIANGFIRVLNSIMKFVQPKRQSYGLYKPAAEIWENETLKGAIKDINHILHEDGELHTAVKKEEAERATKPTGA